MSKLSKAFVYGYRNGTDLIKYVIDNPTNWKENSVETLGSKFIKENPDWMEIDYEKNPDKMVFYSGFSIGVIKEYAKNIFSKKNKPKAD